MSIGELLANTLSPDQRLREDATNKLEEIKRQDFGTYVHMLCQELANESSNQSIRQSAGLALKNVLSAREEHRQEEYASRWMALALEARGAIKHICLQTLHTRDTRTATTAAQVIAAIAAVELPHGQWTDLIKSLLDNMNVVDNHTLRIASLQTIGFVCEEMETSNVLEAQSDAILTAIVAGARKEETNMDVRMAAMNALYNSLEFVRHNFEREGERNYIMQVVCEATQCDITDIQITSFECLVKIMGLYYDKMGVYMQKALFGLTVLGMKHENEKVAQQAIEFWSTVCDEELDIAYEADDAEQAGVPASRTSFNFAQAALAEVIPVLLWLLSKKEEDEDEEDWNVPMAAASCLSLFASVAGDGVVMHVIPFVETHIRAGDWRLREAAVMAFGCIVEGPSPELLGPLVSQALPVLIEMMKDPMLQVRDSTAWAIGRICGSLHKFIPGVHLEPLIVAICSGLGENTRIGSNCCWAIMNLAEQYGLDEQSSEPGVESYTLSKYYEHMVKALLAASDRVTTDHNFRASAFETISVLVTHSAKDCFPTVDQLVRVVIEKLENGLQTQGQLVGMDEKTVFYETQANLCSVLTSVIRRLVSDVAPIADTIMATLLRVMQHTSKTSTVMEDAFLAVGALAAALELNFLRYVDSFMPFLYTVLQNAEEHQACSIAVGIIGDLSRAITDKLAPYCPQLMTILIQHLSDPSLDRSLKPTILIAFGDIALAIGDAFVPFLEHVMIVLMQAASVNFAAAGSALSHDLYEYQNVLREAVIEALVGIVQGLKGTEKSALLLPYCEHIFAYVSSLQKDSNRTEEISRGMVGLLGDLAEAFPTGQLRPLFSTHAGWIDLFFKELKTDREASMATREVLKWAREVIRRQQQIGG